jgi:hypothetical protein
MGPEKHHYRSEAWIDSDDFSLIEQFSHQVFSLVKECDGIPNIKECTEIDR